MWLIQLQNSVIQLELKFKKLNNGLCIFHPFSLEKADLLRRPLRVRESEISLEKKGICLLGNEIRKRPQVSGIIQKTFRPVCLEISVRNSGVYVYLGKKLKRSLNVNFTTF